MMKKLLVLITLSFFLLSCSSIRLVNFEASKCQEYCTHGIISESVEKNTTTIIYGTGSHCCVKFKGAVRFENDTLFLRSCNFKEPCKCLCAYELTYKVKGLKSSSYTIVEERHKECRYQKRRERIHKLREENPERYKRIRKRESMLSYLRYSWKREVVPVIKVIFTDPEE